MTNNILNRVIKNQLLVLMMFILPLVATNVSADKNFDLDQYKGKVVYVDFWASWCTPCRESFPFMQALTLKYGDSLKVVAINVDKDRTEAEKFLNQFTTDFEIVYDPEGVLAQSFEVKGMPTSYLYDREGQLTGSHIGFRKKDIDALEAAIAGEINKK